MPNERARRDHQEVRLAYRAYLEARGRAMGRGLTDEDIEKEQDDDDSQFWKDVETVAERLRRDRKPR